jgi:Rad51
MLFFDLRRVIKLSQNVIVKPTLSQPVFPLNLRGLKDVFPGFALGDFAVLKGSVLSLTSLLCVKAQLPTQLGGLQSHVIFIDGGNTFSLYQIAQFAQIHRLNPKQVLDNIFISRAFTAYQLASLITNQLKEVIKKYDAKLAIISDIAGVFLDKDIPEYEAQRIFNQVTLYLSNFARENKVIIIATYPPHMETERNNSLQTQTCTKTNVVLSIRKTSYARQITIEKHPCLTSSIAELPDESSTLADFLEMAA